MNRKFFQFIQISLLVGFLFSQAAPGAVFAQEQNPPTGPIYIIQPGDNLSAIAARFNVPLADLMKANNMANANNISAGARLIIPGLEGLTGILTTQVIGYGETLQNVSRRNQIPEHLLRRLNHITSPVEMYAGVSLIVPEREGFTPLSNRVGLEPGQTLLESAILENTDPWTITSMNNLAGTWAPLPGEILYAPGTPVEGAPEPNGMPSAFIDVTVNPLPLIQGDTTVIKATTQPGVVLSGSLVDKPLQFFSAEGDNTFIALQGVHAMLDPGVYPLIIEAAFANGEKQSFEQMVVIETGYYPNDPVLVVPAETIDQNTSDTETGDIIKITANATPTRYWQTGFSSPAYFSDCFTSRYGNRRLYQAKEDSSITFTSFHTGQDFCGGEGLPITAPAPGVVVFAGPLTVRGNATIIDHGWGVYSGFWHQSKINVVVGQTVQTGDVIGEVGGTGRVTGAHLHWEIWVNGIQVNPIRWLERAFP